MIVLITYWQMTACHQGRRCFRGKRERDLSRKDSVEQQQKLDAVLAPGKGCQHAEGWLSSVV